MCRSLTWNFFTSTLYIISISAARNSASYDHQRRCIWLVTAARVTGISIESVRFLNTPLAFNSSSSSSSLFLAHRSSIKELLNQEVLFSTVLLYQRNMKEATTACNKVWAYNSAFYSMNRIRPIQGVDRSNGIPALKNIFFQGKDCSAMLHVNAYQRHCMV